MKEKENKSTTYSGDSIASKYLSGTWLGNLLGYGNNSYTDGYGTTRQYAPLNESAQGQQLKRMGETAKDTGKIILTGASFMNPTTAGSTAASLLGTGAQSYFITEGLRDAYNRYMNPNKTAGDAVWTGLDLLGAVPAARSLYNGVKNFNTRSLFPSRKSATKEVRQFEVSDKELADIEKELDEIIKNQPNINPSPKQNNDLDNLDDFYEQMARAVRAQEFESAVRRGQKKAADFLNSDVRKEALDHNTELLKRSFGYDIDLHKVYKNSAQDVTTPMWQTTPNPYASGAKWVGNPDDGFFVADNINGPTAAGAFIKTSGYIAPLDEIYISSKYPESAENIAFHEFLHRGSLGESYKGPVKKSTFSDYLNLMTDHFYDWKTDKLVNKNADIYFRTPGEAAANAMDLGQFAGLTIGQPYPGKKAALTLFADMEEASQNSPGWLYRISNYNWRQHPKRVWDALTGRYYTLPLVGAGLGVAASTLNNNENDTGQPE